MGNSASQVRKLDKNKGIEQEAPVKKSNERLYNFVRELFENSDNSKEISNSLIDIFQEVARYGKNQIKIEQSKLVNQFNLLKPFFDKFTFECSKDYPVDENYEEINTLHELYEKKQLIIEGENLFSKILDNFHIPKLWALFIDGDDWNRGCYVYNNTNQRTEEYYIESCILLFLYCLWYFDDKDIENLSFEDYLRMRKLLTYFESSSYEGNCNLYSDLKYERKINHSISLEKDDIEKERDRVLNIFYEDISSSFNPNNDFKDLKFNKVDKHDKGEDKNKSDNINIGNKENLIYIKEEKIIKRQNELLSVKYIKDEDIESFLGNLPIAVLSDNNVNLIGFSEPDTAKIIFDLIIRLYKFRIKSNVDFKTAFDELIRNLERLHLFFDANTRLHWIIESVFLIKKGYLPRIYQNTGDRYTYKKRFEVRYIKNALENTINYIMKINKMALSKDENIKKMNTKQSF
ncbi:MAG: hypothetical protein N4A49_08045 [Marinifilaceae bacterium]|jgi:hypothetical protein|nr:hypothetical protein [Marinifilaceae bacterium]